MVTGCKLTTVDNPFDPFEDFRSWYLFDMEKGYDSCGRLMRIANISDEMTQLEVDQELERAMNEIVKHDFTNTYRKVTRTTAESTSAST